MTDLAGSLQERVGLVGFGLLGAAFASRLKAAGFALSAYDVDPLRRADMRAAGVAVAASPDELSGSCEYVVLTVYSGGQVNQVIDELAAVTEPAGRRPAVVCSTTLAPGEVNSIAARAEHGGFAFIEFPVSGTSAQIVAGVGLGLCGADAAVVAASRHLLGALTPEFVHIGPVGTAARAKLAINLVLEINRSAMAEGMFFAQRLGLNAACFGDILRASAAYSRVMDGKLPKLLADDFAPEGRLAQSLKDVDIMLAEAERHGCALPLLEAQAGHLRACITAGDGDLDGIAVIRELRRRAT